MGRASHTFIPIEQKLKEIREGQSYFIQTINELSALLDAIPDDDLPLYLNVNIQWVDEDCYMHDRSAYWRHKIKERLSGIQKTNDV